MSSTLRNKNNRYLTLVPFYPVELLLFILILSSCSTKNNHPGSPLISANGEKAAVLLEKNGIDFKQKGAHVFSRIDTSNLSFLTRNNVDWVTLVAWGDQKDYDSADMRHHNGDSLRIKKRDSIWVNRLELLHTAGFKVFLKPHIWINSPSDGKWRSDIFPKNEEDWTIWKDNYRDFILRYARIAQRGQAEMFCIGTEFSKLSVQKPAYWKALIKEVRNIYSGKLTYAANWYQEFESITFWDELDYIGIQAYFPLVKNEYPSVQEISKGWNEYLPSLAVLHEKYNKKILFTELGYKSTSDSAITPWEWMDDPQSTEKAYSVETQANCYEAFFNTVWDQDWFAGVHLWQLRSDYPNSENIANNRDFTPLGKPAEKKMAEGFGR